MENIKSLLRKLFGASISVSKGLIAVLLIGLGTLVYLSWDGGGADEEAVPCEGPVEHCGCEGTCEKCHHLCLECKCGSHIIDRGIKCQELAACEAGCSGVDSGGPVDTPVGLTGGGASQGCQDLAFVGSYLLEPDRFSDPSDAPYVEKLLASAAQELGCRPG